MKKNNLFIKKKDLQLLVNDHCVLRIITKKDISNNYIRWMNDSEITKYTEQRYQKHSSENIEMFIEDKLKSKLDFLFGIFFENKHIGNIKLGPVKWEHLSSEISFFIGEKNFLGKGIMSAAVNKIVDFAFQELGLEKINAGYYEKNIASGKLFEKCGFNIEGVRDSNIIFEGKRIKSVLVGILKK
jgi:RimJ/RimL family protein N-acetyltransferase|tara:strand:+ start:512 stop:1066 length:555 start_codon:yes stop_codon:yes gene_type:complete